MALAMSRSIGDADGKRVGLTALPEVDVWDRTRWFEAENLDSEKQSDIEVSMFLGATVSLISHSTTATNMNI